MRTTIKFFVTVVFLTSAASLFLFYSYLQSPLPIQAETSLILESGDHLKKITTTLAAQQHITHPRLLYYYGRLSGKARQIKTGEYALMPGLTHKQLLDKLVSGDVVHNSITFVEGWNMHQMLVHLGAQEKLTKILAGTDRGKVMALLGYPEDHGEGQFAPDTYYFTSTTTDKELLEQAWQRQKLILQEEWQQRAPGLPYQTPYDALIMASIVEKETGAAHERAQIAGVFIRRLNKNMRLQTDPTVIYGLGQSFDGNIKYIHLKQKTPYNTYVIKGLPPTPIAMPGRDAIHAALHPAEGAALYFVARGDGTHKFSSTLQEHQAAVKQFQLNRKDNYHSTPTPH